MNILESNDNIEVSVTYETWLNVMKIEMSGLQK